MKYFATCHSLNFTFDKQIQELQMYHFIENAIQWLEMKAGLHTINFEKKAFILVTLTVICYL